MANTILEVLSRVNGNLSLNLCKILYRLASEVPEEGIILDLGTGEGRSSIIMARTLEEVRNPGAQVISVETHISNILSDTPHEDGTLMNFMSHLRHFKTLHRVVPVVGSITQVSPILPRRSINLVVFQTSSNSLGYADQTEQAISLAPSVVRKSGRLVFITPVGTDPDQFGNFIGNRIGSEFEKVSDEAGAHLFEYKRGNNDNG